MTFSAEEVRSKATRLNRLSLAVAQGEKNEFTMRVPAEPDRDAYLVLQTASNMLSDYAAMIEQRESVTDDISEIVNDPESICPICKQSLHVSSRQARKVPKGYVLVPRKPSEKMSRAGLNAKLPDRIPMNGSLAFADGQIRSFDDADAVYNAMLAAAPPAPSEEVE